MTEIAPCGLGSQSFIDLGQESCWVVDVGDRMTECQQQFIDAFCLLWDELIYNRGFECSCIGLLICSLEGLFPVICRSKRLK
ncbi:hypothetical protein C469_00440 [Halorubrum lipolyticum DSM 21995]|uniref:Uncharacterized protein n=1 Tax=Halorubrum lipolyticum DSM 21995 TaxID=1227482 RepID=M0P4E3_9EURY|nr:hypothetical protein C469_00440 [Halorubrum lipolyticum DSM 21995]